MIIEYVDVTDATEETALLEAGLAIERAGRMLRYAVMGDYHNAALELTKVRERLEVAEQVWIKLRQERDDNGTHKVDID